MALRYDYGLFGWGLDPRGRFRTPQELGKWFGYDEAGYDQLHFSRYEGRESLLLNPNWIPGSLETRVRYSRDFMGNYYMDPNGIYRSGGIHEGRERAMKNVPVSAASISDFE